MHAYIQWKGTNVCMDWTCATCGYHNHEDADFCYWVRCRGCRAVYEVSAHVGLTPFDLASLPVRDDKDWDQETINTLLDEHEQEEEE